MNKKVIKKNVKQWLKDTKQGDLAIGFSKDGDFCYDNEPKDKIEIGDLFSTLEQNKEFLSLCRRLGIKQHYKIGTLCFLHELGHYKTHGDFNEEQEKYDKETREDLYEMINNEATESLGIYLYYRLLDQEIEATRWAVEFANKYPNQTKKLELALYGD